MEGLRSLVGGHPGRVVLLLGGLALLLPDRHAVMPSAIDGRTGHWPDLLGQHLGGADSRRLERGLLIV